MAITKLRNRGITDDAVTTDKIAPATVASSDIAPGTIASSNIAPGAITADRISPAVTLGVPAVTSDPPTPSLSVGNMWLRTDTVKLRTYVNIPTGSWSTGGSQTSNNQPGGSGGPQTSHWVSQGDWNSSYRSNYHASYDGTSFTALTNHPLGDSSGFGTGTETDHLSGLGHTDPGGTTSGHNSTPSPYYLSYSIYHWNGSSWSSDSTFPTGTSDVRGCHGAGGTSSAAMVVTGWRASPYLWGHTDCYDWNNTSWSSATAFPVTNNGVSITGTPTDLLSIGKNNYTFSYDGSTWTQEGNTVNTAPGGQGAWGGSTSKAYIGSDTGLFQTWNGTSWSSDVTQPDSYGGKGGSGGSDGPGLVTGGYNPASGYLARTHEYTAGGLQITNLN